MNWDLIWTQFASILFAGGLMIFINGTAEGHVLAQFIGSFAFTLGTLELVQKFKEESK